MTDVGSISVDGTTFDIDGVDETDSLIIRTDTNNVVKTRWIFRDEAGRMIIHERSKTMPNIVEAGSYLSISEIPGYASQQIGNRTSSTVAKLATNVDFEDLEQFTTKQITHNGETYTAALVPVILL